MVNLVSASLADSVEVLACGGSGSAFSLHLANARGGVPLSAEGHVLGLGGNLGFGGKQQKHRSGYLSDARPSRTTNRKGAAFTNKRPNAGKESSDCDSIDNVFVDPDATI